MQPRIRLANPPADYSFPWSMAEEGEPSTTAGRVGLEFELVTPKEFVHDVELPISFRAWLLEHHDELLRH